MTILKWWRLRLEISIDAQKLWHDKRSSQEKLRFSWRFEQFWGFWNQGNVVVPSSAANLNDLALRIHLKIFNNYLEASNLALMHGIEALTLVHTVIDCRGSSELVGCCCGVVLLVCRPLKRISWKPCSWEKLCSSDVLCKQKIKTSKISGNFLTTTLDVRSSEPDWKPKKGFLLWGRYMLPQPTFMTNSAIRTASGSNVVSSSSLHFRHTRATISTSRESLNL